jgi:ABC-type phosphate/phosphonate transport system substrate-binding protein
MIRRLLPLLALFMFLAACEPEVQTVEVTRLVEVASPPNVITRVVTDVITETLTSEIAVTRIISSVETVTIEATPVLPGTDIAPIQMLFPPSVPEAIIQNRAQLLVDNLSQTTGLQYELLMLDSQQAIIDALCAAPNRSIAFLPALAAVAAMNQCGAPPLLAGERLGYSWHAGMFVTLAANGIGNDAGVEALSDLPSQRWGHVGTTAVANVYLAREQLAESGVTISEEMEYTSETNTLLGLLDGEVDFVTASFDPPLMPEGEDAWQYGVDSSETWRVLGLPAFRSPLGHVEILSGPDSGGYRIRDARAALIDTMPTIFDDTRIVALTPPVPNGTVSLGPQIPLAIALQINQALQDFGNSDACAQSICSSDFMNWHGLAPVSTQDYSALAELSPDSDLLGRLDPEY